MAIAILVLAIGEIALHGVTVTGHWDRNRLGFSRTLFELDLANSGRFLVHAALLFVLVAGRLMERDGYRPSIAMLVLAIVLALAVFVAVPAASPAGWSGDEEVTPQRREALMHSAWGALIGLVWGLLAMDRVAPLPTLTSCLLLPVTIGTTLGSRAGLIALMLAGVLTVFPSIGGHRRDSTGSIVSAHAYLLACLIVWLGWAAWPGLLRTL
jgi:hypothetical protein